MKIHLLICLAILLLGSQATLPISPSGALEDYKSYLRGVCAAIAIDCDLTPVSSCWNNDSALGALNVIYEAYKEVVNSTPKTSSTMLKSVLTERADKYVAPIEEALRCEEKLPYARLFYEKMDIPGQKFEGVFADIIHYASVRPEITFTVVKNIVAMIEEGKFEAMGLLDGNFICQSSALRRKQGSDWRTNATNGRRLLLKGMCESLGLKCPMESLNSMDEQASATDLHTLHEWFSSVVTKPIIEGVRSGIELLSGRRKETWDLLKSEIEKDKSSEVVKLITEKLGFDMWSKEWVEAVSGFVKEFPELSWHYKVSEHKLLENNDLEGLGIVLGLDWLNVAEWKRGKFVKNKSPGLIDL